MIDRLPNRIVPLLAGAILLGTIARAQSAKPPELQLTGDWQITVRLDVEDNGKVKTLTQTLDVTPAPLLVVRAEKHDSLPVFNPKAGGWAKGAALQGVKAQECTTLHLLDPISLELRAGPEADAPLLKVGKDYDVDLAWGTFGRMAGDGLPAGQSVYASYRHGVLRLDSIVLTREPRIVLREGEPRPAAPQAPALQDGERRLANLWIPGRINRLTTDHLFPVLEAAYPAPPVERPSAVEKLCPLTLEKLRSGEAVKILAWGDSVTDGGYLPGGARDRWQEQFAARLRERFPQSQIELVTEAWGGRSTSSYLNEPPGSEHNYREKVLAPKPDLIVSEFVNDAGLNPEQVGQRYGQLLSDFQSIGAEWIILTPHYVRPDWMGLTRERDCDEDPRPYVKGLRQFAATHPVALADASLRYGRLWRQGIPYNTLMLNSINHPDARGMKIFVDSLMQLFPAK